jgi:hypothetical protein
MREALERFVSEATRSRLPCRKEGTHRDAIRSLAFPPAGVSQYETGARARVASKLLEAATNGERSVDDLKRVGQKALGTGARHVALNPAARSGTALLQSRTAG